MELHLKNVRQELLNTQQLCDAKAKEIETEDHMKQLAEKEAARLFAENKQLDKQLGEHKDKLNLTQNRIYEASEKIEAVKQQMNWNNEELEQWYLAAKQKEEDNLALQKYQRQDEAKVKELDMQIVNLTKELNAKKQALQNEVTDTQAAQIELDKTAEDFRKLHKERQELVSQWQEAIDAMQRRDQSIQEAADRFAEGKLIIEAKAADMAEKNKFLDVEKNNIKEIEAKIAEADRFVAKSRTLKVEQEFVLNELRDEVEVMRNTMKKAASDLGKSRTDIQVAHGDTEDKERRLDMLRSEAASVKMRLENEFQHCTDLEKRAKQLEELHLMEEQRGRAKDKELSDLRELQFKQSQELFKLRQDETNKMAEISGAQTANKNMASKIAKLDEEAQKQQELVYTADFKIQQMERKVARAQGERSEQEKKDLLLKIDELQQELDQATAQHKMLGMQAKKVGDDVRDKLRQLAQTRTLDEKLSQQISEITLENDSASKEVKLLLAKREDLTVQHDMLKLETAKLRDRLNSRADEVFGLENRKFQLKMSMEEREHEIGVHRDVLKASLKVASEELHKTQLQLSDRKMKLDKMQKKYDLLLAKFAPGEGEERQSEAFFLIKAAQEKQELEREGDDLDAQIRKAEKEVRALENTLSMLGSRNAAYRKSFHKPEGGDNAVAKKSSQEKQLRAAMDKLKFKRSEIKELNVEIATMRRSTTSLAGEKARMEQHIEQLSLQAVQLEKEVAEQKAKLETQKREVVAAAQSWRASRDVDSNEETPEELDFRLQDVKYSNRQMLGSLAELGRQDDNADVVPILEQLLLEADLASVMVDAQDGGDLSRPPSQRRRAGGGRRTLTPSHG